MTKYKLLIDINEPKSTGKLFDQLKNGQYDDDGVRILAIKRVDGACKADEFI